LGGANLEDAQFDDADLTNADLSGITNWKTITHFSGANIHAVRNAPDGFIAMGQKPRRCRHFFRFPNHRAQQIDLKFSRRRQIHHALR
jgi:hypothetical protein